MRDSLVSSTAKIETFLKEKTASNEGTRMSRYTSHSKITLRPTLTFNTGEDRESWDTISLSSFDPTLCFTVMRCISLYVGLPMM